ncbi:MAG TPA: tetraacyldisaccharide 4'-kinase, partial [Cyclobacteriaceae bacterium]
MGIFNVLLYPFAVLFRIATGIRNHLYSIGYKRSFQFGVPVISVGNLSLGGSGKTPAIEYLIRLLRNREKIATLSRGYGRRTKGLRFATEADNVESLGDEPYQFYRKFGKEVQVVVGEDRAFAIPNILHGFEQTSILLLDDAYQHRSVRPHLNILLTDYAKPFYEDYLIPMGRLREGRVGAMRADIIIITKCPEYLDAESQKIIKEKVDKFAYSKPVFFSYIQYGSPVSFFDPQEKMKSKVVLLSGIAKAKPLLSYIKGNFELVKHFGFRDHHMYTLNELAQVKKFIQAQPDPVSLITTEKDMVRLLHPKFKG